MISKVQLGKNGITENFISTLKSHFQKHSNVHISILPSARNEKKAKDYEKEILDILGSNYSARTLGFVVKVKRLRRGKES